MKSSAWAAVILLALATLCQAPAAKAQDLLSDALSWLPPQTVALEYSHPSVLRSLPAYSSLRTRYLGKNLRALEVSLQKLGIHDTDIDEMVLGWQTGVGSAMTYEGLATGQFDASTIRHSAEASKMAPRSVDGAAVYCFPQDPNHTCVTVVDATLGVFGPLPFLQQMLKARAGNGPSIASNTQFTQYAREAQTQDPIWGIAMGSAVSKWFKAWMPGEKNLQMDWANAFKDVQAISYTIAAADNVNLNVKLDCATLQAASQMRQLLEGLKLFQQIAWRSANPNQPNPFQNLEVDARDRQVSFKLTADYTALEHTGPLGKP